MRFCKELFRSAAPPAAPILDAVKARVGDLELEYETAGDHGSRPLLLINGLGSQLILWPPAFLRALVDRGFFVIRFDNRDVGLSTWFDDRAGYTLDDMAADAAGLLEQIGVERAHVAGSSMGGMIAQLVAVNHPERVLSLTSIMSNLGGTDVAYGEARAVAALRQSPPADLASAVEAGLEARRVLSGGNPIDEEEVRLYVAAAYNRAFHPAGTARQLEAVNAAPSRREALGRLRVPALVIHGLEDPLVVPENGRRTAAAIPGSRLLQVPGMGHNFADHALDLMADAIAEMARQAVAL